MLLSFQTDNQTFTVNTAHPVDLSIPLDFYGAQPNAFGVEKAVSQPCEAGSLVGDTRRGGSCNFEQITFIPHCNGTHTECVGHLTRERIAVRDCLKEAFIPAALISIKPERAIETGETYAVEFAETDTLISRKQVALALEKLEDSGSKIQNPPSKALIVRTLPNPESKKTQTYLENIPPFFSIEAMRLIVEKGFSHLLVDLPSIDRIFDEGKLANHRIFWNVEPGEFEMNPETRVNNTITELIYVPEEAEDGQYLLNLQIAPFVADAAPSRPLLLKIIS